MENASRQRDHGDRAARVDPATGADEGRAVGTHAAEEALKRRELLETDDKVWDLVYNLAHPTALYVLFQLLISSRLGDTPALRGYHAVDPVPLAIYAGQFLGAWAVFYTTLLRDMGYRCAPGTVLLIAGLAGAVGQYFVFPVPRDAAVGATWAWLGVQLGLAVLAWPLVFARWIRLKKQVPAP